MTRWMSLGGMAATATLLSSTALWAEVSAMGVWEDWKTYMEGVGYDVSTGSENVSGDTLTVNGLTMSMGSPDDNGAISMAMEFLEFRERNDGTVEISLPDDYAVLVQGGDPGEELDLELTVSQTGMTIIASGDESETAYDFVAAEIGFEATRFNVNGEPVNAAVEGSLAGYTGNYVMTRGDLNGIAGGARADRFEMTLNIDEPEEDAVIDFAMAAADIGGDMDMSLPVEFDPEDMSAALAAGFAVAGEYSVGEMEMRLAGVAEGNSFDVQMSTGEAGFDFEMGQDGLGLSELVSDLSIAISGSEIPFPQIVIAAREYGLNFLMPVTQSEEPQDFALGLRLVDLAVQDEIWAMFDPMGILPRDPATIVVDTEGKANWFYDIMDAAAQEAMTESGAMPGAVHELTLNDLEVTMAGAALTGSGAFTFDNDDLATFEGVPRPEGSVDLKLVGANGLLDKLIQMGLMPEDQAMGMRMMMGLFAVPGDGEDTLNSRIEVNEQGQVLANGQRLR